MTRGSGRAGPSDPHDCRAGAPGRVFFFFGIKGTDSFSDPHHPHPSLSHSGAWERQERLKHRGRLPGKDGGCRTAAQEHAATELGQLVAADACKLNFEVLPCPSNGTL